MSMNDVIIRNVLRKDLNECFQIEAACYAPEEAAGKEAIERRLKIFPQGFFVAEIDGRLAGMLNSASTDKEDISDEELKQLIGHDVHGKHMVVFSLVVLPRYRKQGVAFRLMTRFIEASRALGKEAILLICKYPLVTYYERLSFIHMGLSRSMHGGAQWHEMRFALRAGTP
jgi:ribosomal protein S18 acetylase RimI-like enzyme